MNDGLKQRIVGALVLIALGVIFVPVLFDRERIAPVDRVSQIPPEPDITVFPLPEPPTVPAALKDVKTEVADGRFKIEEPEVGQEDENAIAVIESENTEKNTDSELKPTWVLQVASFSSEERAKEMMKKIEKLGLRGFTRASTSEYGKHTRVYVGPSFRKEELEQEKTSLDQKFGLNAMVLKYRP